MTIGDTGHPLWSFLRFLVIAGVATTGLWLNASNFDETEIRALLWLLGGMAGMEGAGQWLRSREKKAKDVTCGPSSSRN